MAESRTAERRHLVETYTSYAEAERVVDRLSDDGFPVERLTIVAEGLSLAENVTGRRNYLDAAAGGTVTGGVIGALLGFVFGVFSWVDPLVSGIALALYGFVVGAVVGLVLGLVGHWMLRGRRDFSSRTSLDASRYDVVADDAEVAEEAARRLASIDLG